MIDNEDVTLSHLQYSFGLVNEWLRFADAKLATALGFNGVAVSVVVGVITGDAAAEWPDFARYWLLWAGIGFALAAMIALVTLSPIVKPGKLKASRLALAEGDDTPNPYFFGDAGRLSVDELLAAIERSPARDIAKQITINSRIARRKYRGFTTVAATDVIAVFPPYLLWVCGAGVVRLMCRESNGD